MNRPDDSRGNVIPFRKSSATATVTATEGKTDKALVEILEQIDRASRRGTADD